MSYGKGISTEAVIFFDGEMPEQLTVVKEMLYPEFEAILDHVVGIQDFADKTIRSAYVRIDSHLNVTAVVLFCIDFDEQGHPGKSWNIPLQHLAETAGRGPDLGAGPIRLSCRSQCSVSWHQRELWDPYLEKGNNTLEMLARTAKRNRLGLLAPEPEPPTLEPTGKEAKVDRKQLEKLSEKLQREFQEKQSALIEEYKLRVTAAESEAQEHINKLTQKYRQDLKSMAEALETAKQLFGDEKKKNAKLKQMLEAQAGEMRESREQFQQDIHKAKNIEASQLSELEKKYEFEIKASVDNATAELKEMLDMREVELFYRDEQIAALKEEIVNLRQEKQSLVSDTGDNLLKRLVECGVTFVAYHPGIEHLTIPLSDIPSYLEAPVDYASRAAQVDKELYMTWLAHHDMPVCNHLESGKLCGIRVRKVTKPSRFIPGESDRCAKHSLVGSTLSSLMKVREST